MLFLARLERLGQQAQQRRAEAVRRIVLGQAPYPAVSPAPNRDRDVIEIRRAWRVDKAVRLY